MRILLAADIHYSLKQLDWLSSTVGSFDLLVIAGDLLDLAGHADLDTQTVVIEKYLRKMSATAPLAVCSGNHDLDATSETGERRADWLLHLDLDRVSVDHQRLVVNGCHISVCPWWDGPESREEVAGFLRTEAAAMHRPWIWIYHAPPDGSKTGWNGKNYSGDTFLSELIGQHHPDIVLGGHIHNSPFRNEGRWFDRVDGTWVFNPGRQHSSTPAVIVLDLNKAEATWHSEMDTETIQMRGDAAT